MMLLMIITAAQPVNARKKRTVTTHPRIVRTTEVSDTLKVRGVIVTDKDSVASAVRLSGYDKTMTSSTEGIFVLNLTGDTISALTIHIDYKDMKGRSMHQRDLRLEDMIPPGESRREDFTSWDRQKIFYYRLSSSPRRKNAVPYDVSVKAVSVEFLK